MSDKQFIGNVKEITTKYGTMLKIGISEREFVQHIKNGWVNMVLKQNKEGKHYLEVDAFEPKAKVETVEVIDLGNDLPF